MSAGHLCRYNQIKALAKLLVPLLTCFTFALKKRYIVENESERNQRERVKKNGTKRAGKSHRDMVMKTLASLKFFLLKR